MPRCFCFYHLSSRLAERALLWHFGFTVALGPLPGQGLCPGELWKDIHPTTPAPTPGYSFPGF